MLREVLHRLPESQGERKPPLGNSKANLSALNNYKMNVKDQR
ncbi:hypothetical protein [Paenibacillus sp. JCM 10914]|nr:hypothetical protein [Paenibacillus sp. JCM 10914]